jgi:hypothetical protein
LNCIRFPVVSVHPGGVRYLVGTNPAAKAYPMWQELGVLPGQGLYHDDEFNGLEHLVCRRL